MQCEKCHGPGSEYMDERVMRDPEAARRAGLRRFTKRDCAVCHYVKGSHVAVHRKPALDVDAAWQALAHPVPPGGGPGGARPPPRRRLRPRARSTSGRRPAAPATRARGWATSSACGA